MATIGNNVFRVLCSEYLHHITSWNRDAGRRGLSTPDVNHFSDPGVGDNPSHACRTLQFSESGDWASGRVLAARRLELQRSAETVRCRWCVADVPDCKRLRMFGVLLAELGPVSSLQLLRRGSDGKPAKLPPLSFPAETLCSRQLPALCGKRLTYRVAQ